jgi:hypothetical protein
MCNITKYCDIEEEHKKLTDLLHIISKHKLYCKKDLEKIIKTKNSL